ncbi:MAG: DUF448 domain-containing protein [Myxococcota bacterium]
MTEPEDHVPQRTCVACRDDTARDDLVRLVLDPEGQLVVDLRGRLPGRGAWVHPTAACLDRLEAEPKRLSHALKAPADPAGLRARVHALVLASVYDGLSLASRAGALIGGHDAVEFAIRDGRVAELVVASDAAERTVRDLARDPSMPITSVPLSKDDLGARIGQPPRAVVGIVASPAFRHLREQLRRLRSLG